MTETTRTLLDAAVEHAPTPQIAEAGDQFPFVRLISDPRNFTTRVEDLERLAPAPRRVRQVVRHETPQSFAAYVNAFGGAATRIFASLDKRQVSAEIDFHAAADAASWRTHRAVYPAVFDEAFAAWSAVHERPMTQRDFAEFLEDRAADAVIPDPADLMEVAQKFDAIRNVTFRGAVNLHTNERAFHYEEKDAAGGAVACPRVIRLRTPVFYGTDPVEWAARLAYAISDGKLSFTVRIHRLPELLDASFERLCDAIAVDCPKTPLHRGLAE